MNARQSRLPLVAAVLAAAAVALGVVAVVLLVHRPAAGAAATASTGGGVAVDDGAAPATDVAAALVADVAPRGLGFDAGAVPAWRQLGLREGDVLRSVQGVRDRLQWPMLGAGPGAGLAVLYLEVERDGQAMVVRRTITGDFAQAQLDALTAAMGRSAAAAGARPFGYDPSVPAPAPDPVLAAPPPDPVVADAISKITRIDDGHYVLPRDLIDEVLTNPMAFARGARVVPSVKNGAPNGFKLYAIKPSSLYAALGLENGDELEAVNGKPLAGGTPPLAMYEPLRRASRLDVTGRRRGKPLTLTYEIK